MTIISLNFIIIRSFDHHREAAPTVKPHLKYFSDLDAEKMAREKEREGNECWIKMLPTILPVPVRDHVNRKKCRVREAAK